MNPDLPPIADPHSTHSLPPETAPRTPGTAILGLIHVILGAGMLVLGVVLPAYSLWLMARVNVALNVAGTIFTLFIFVVACGIGFVLVRHGLRIWKHGR